MSKEIKNFIVESLHFDNISTNLCFVYPILIASVMSTMLFYSHKKSKAQ